MQFAGTDDAFYDGSSSRSAPQGVVFHAYPCSATRLCGVEPTVVVDLREQAYTALQAFLPEMVQHTIELRVLVGQPP